MRKRATIEVWSPGTIGNATIRINNKRTSLTPVDGTSSRCSTVVQTDSEGILAFCLYVAVTQGTSWSLNILNEEGKSLPGFPKEDFVYPPSNAFADSIQV